MPRDPTRLPHRPPSMLAPMQVVVVSQTCAVAWRSPEGTYTGNECGQRLSQQEFEQWYADWNNPKNPKKQLVIFTAKATTDAVIITINLYDPSSK